MKSIFRVLSIILLVSSLGYLTYRLLSKKFPSTSIEFTTNQYTLNGFHQDSLYHFNAIVKNYSSQNQKYSVMATCGCTVISSGNNMVRASQKDTVKIAINTYGKNHDFTSNLILYGENKNVLDTLFIVVKNLNK